MRYFWLFLCAILFAPSSYPESLIVATSPFNPPFEIAADNKGHFFGFEIDFMNEICKRLNVKCLYKGLSLKEIFSELSEGNVDVGINSISITYEREKQFIFSLPYLESYARLLTISSSEINNLQQVDGARIGCIEASAFIDVANNMFKNVTVVRYKLQNDLFQAVANQSVDLVFLDNDSAIYWVNNNSGIFKLVGKPITVGFGFGIVASPNKLELIKRINAAMMQLQNDGTYLKIYSRYF